MEKHNKKCWCFSCRNGKAAKEKWQQEMLAKEGWYIEYVPGDDGCPNNINIHTHGLQENFNHPDLQICIGIKPQTAAKFFHDLVGRIKKGERFETGKIYSDIAARYDTQFIDAFECGRPVLRMVIPNEKNTYEGKIYQAQFTMLDNQD